MHLMSNLHMHHNRSACDCAPFTDNSLAYLEVLVSLQPDKAQTATLMVKKTRLLFCIFKLQRQVFCPLHRQVVLRKAV